MASIKDKAMRVNKVPDIHGGEAGGVRVNGEPELGEKDVAVGGGVDEGSGGATVGKLATAAHVQYSITECHVIR
ncbi:Hydrolase_4 domain-containing protein [Psidium guajava]|nr:Hydrolase_4 domain-containing protein [Psidium guajava]